MVQKLQDKRVYVKYFNGKKITFMGYPCVIGGYSQVAYLLYIKSKHNDNRLASYCFEIKQYANNLIHNASNEFVNELFGSKVFKLVNRNYNNYDYIMWIPCDNLDCFYDEKIDNIEVPGFVV